MTFARWLVLGGVVALVAGCGGTAAPTGVSGSEGFTTQVQVKSGFTIQVQTKSEPLLHAWDKAMLSDLRVDRNGVHGKKVCSLAVTIHKTAPRALRKWAGEKLTISVHTTPAAQTLAHEWCALARLRA